jgi:ferredoxin
MLDILEQNKVQFEGFGACEGTLACSTCHVIFSPADYARIQAGGGRSPPLHF